MNPGAIVGVELRRIALDLVTPFRTSFGEQTSRDVLLVAVTVDHDGAVTTGWGECVALSDPHYSPEFVDGAQLVLAEHLVPLARAAPLTAEALRDRVAGVKGHQMAKAALEMALLDAELRHAGRSFGEWLGVTRTTVPVRRQRRDLRRDRAPARRGRRLRRCRLRPHQAEDPAGLGPRAGGRGALPRRCRRGAAGRCEHRLHARRHRPPLRASTSSTCC
ncbi:MAG: hypothetical protein WKF58_03910 [Ilumatobacteraceae bacterium]